MELITFSNNKIDFNQIKICLKSFHKLTITYIFVINSYIMELTETKTYITPVIEEFIESVLEQCLVYYASDAATRMEFQDGEFQEAMKRAMELCSNAGIPIEENFKKVYKCSYDGISYDWKLSVLGYKLVCVNGGSSNPNVAMMQLQLLQNCH